MLKIILTKILLFFLVVFGFPTKTEEVIPIEKKNLEIKEILVASTTGIKEKTDESPIQTEVKKPTVISKETDSQKTQEQNTPTQNNVVASAPQISFEDINVSTRKALVNIFCTTQSGGPLSSISGSGVLISSNGVILTNAHIGQYFLLKDFNGQKDYIQCVIRTGSPAYPVYNVELIYISPEWVNSNKTILTDREPKGTGEFDYALLRITGKIDKTEEKSTPSLPINIANENITGFPVLLASYPAGFLSSQLILRDLYQSSSVTSISQVFTFGSTTVDLVSVGGTVVSQKGSSGGAVVNSRGELVGIITTSTNADQTSQRDLRAITLSYVERSLKNESSLSLVDIISYPTEYAQKFNQDFAPTLTKIITDAILNK